MKQRKLVPVAASLIMLAAVGLLGSQTLAAQTAAPVPAEYQDLYSSLSGQLAAFNNLVPVSIPTYPVAFSSELLSANSGRGTALLAPLSYSQTLQELNSLKVMGVKAVSISVHFPILYSGYYQDPTQYQQYLTYYTQLAQDIRARGLKLIVESGLVVSQPGITNLDCMPFYNSLTLDQYEQGRMQVAVWIASALRPDYMTVLNEPEEEAAQSGKPQLATVSGSTAFLNVILAGLQQAGINGVAVGAGTGTWTSSYQAYLQSFLGTTIQYIDMHVFPINRDFLTRTLAIADMARAAGKGMAVSQTWLYKVRDSELGLLSFSQIAERDPFSFWAPLDAAYLQSMVRFANYKQLAFFTPYWTNYFRAYLDYPAVSTVSPDQLMSLTMTQAGQNLVAGQYTPVAKVYSAAIVPVTDTLPPSIPSGLTVTGASTTVLHLTWNASSDNLGVAGYRIYKNGALLATAAGGEYWDQNLQPSSTYTYGISAYDVAGNASAVAGPVYGTTLALPDTKPPSVPTHLTVGAVTNAQVNLLWTPSTDDVGVTGYQIFRGASPASLILIAAAGSATYSDTRVAPKSTYYYTVAAYDAHGNLSAQSAPISAATPQAPPPSVPAGVLVKPASSSQVNLSWSASSAANSAAGLGGYLVYRGTSAANLSIIAIAPTTTYSDTHVAPAATYYYSVASYNSWGNASNGSAIVSAKTPSSPPPTIPGGFSVTAVASNQVTLAWSASTSAAGVSGYLISKGITPTTFFMIGQSASTSYVDTAVVSHITYYYTVQAYDIWGTKSAPSASVKVTTP